MKKIVPSKYFLVFSCCFGFFVVFLFSSICLLPKVLLLHPVPLNMLLQDGLLRNARKWISIFKRKLLGSKFQMRSGKMLFHIITFRALKLSAIIMQMSCRKVVLFLLHSHLTSPKIRRDEILKPIKSCSMQSFQVFLQLPPLLLGLLLEFLLFPQEWKGLPILFPQVI